MEELGHERGKEESMEDRVTIDDINGAAGTIFVAGQDTVGLIKLSIVFPLANNELDMVRAFSLCS